MLTVPLPLSIRNLPVISSTVQLFNVTPLPVVILTRLPLVEVPKSGAVQFVIVTFSNTRLPLVTLASLP